MNNLEVYKETPRKTCRYVDGPILNAWAKT